MKLPTKGSRGAQALEGLYAAGPCTIEQALVRHAGFGQSPAGMVDIFERLVAAGCVDLRGGVYSIRILARRYLDQLTRRVPTPGTAAGPAYRPEPKPLDVRRTRIVAPRDGALDYRAVPSLVGSQRVPFKGAA